MSTSGGAKSLTYNINPKGTGVSKVKAVKKGFKVTWKKQAHKLPAVRCSIVPTASLRKPRR